VEQAVNIGCVGQIVKQTVKQRKQTNTHRSLKQARVKIK